MSTPFHPLYPTFLSTRMRLLLFPFSLLCVSLQKIQTVQLFF